MMKLIGGLAVGVVGVLLWWQLAHYPASWTPRWGQKTGETFVFFLGGLIVAGLFGAGGALILAPRCSCW